VKPADYMQKLMDLISMEAKNRRESAGYNGRMDDGGASVLEAQVRFYKLGMEGKFPDEWQEFEKQLDPEYQEYIRLRRKFG
jgi:hypothetical protein